MRPLGTSEFLDHHAPEVRAFAARATGDTKRERIIDLFHLIRDGIEYEIYGADFSRDALRASTIARSERGLCIHKSTLFAACARALGVPSRLAFVDVRNHVASPRLQRYLGGDVVHFHCYARVELEGHWVDATPVFSQRLCQLYRMTPLEFGGVLQENDGSQMEVVRRHGVFDDLPYERIVAGLREAHPNLFTGGGARMRSGSLMAEAA